MSIYTKHRPTSFEDVVGNGITIKQLAGSLKQPLHNHAILLTGETGVGKTTIARIMAMEIYGLTDPNKLSLEINYREINAAVYRGIDIIRDIIGFSSKSHSMLKL